MQVMDRRTQAKLAKLIAALITAVLVAIFGRENLPFELPGGDSGQKSSRHDPFPDHIRGAGRPIDGDSLRIGRDEVRLKGIDAPEGRQTCERDGKAWACGDASRDHLRRLIGRDVVECQVHQRDQHGRLLATCSAAGRPLNGGMVKDGMAVAYGGYRSEEASARNAKRGLWGSKFQTPRAWRDENNTRR